MKELEFRDGKREVPDHIVALVEGITTWTMTYEQAVKAGEQRLLGDKLYQAQKQILAEHFARRDG